MKKLLLLCMVSLLLLSGCGNNEVVDEIQTKDSVTIIIITPHVYYFSNEETGVGCYYNTYLGKILRCDPILEGERE